MQDSDQWIKEWMSGRAQLDARDIGRMVMFKNWRSGERYIDGEYVMKDGKLHLALNGKLIPEVPPPKPTLEQLAQAVLDARQRFSASGIRQESVDSIIERQRALTAVTRAEMALADAVRAEEK